jgi:predicted acylesterase/phospholipase RssA
MAKKKRRRALAFTSGGLDTVMQMGVAHALLVSRGAPPDYVVGVSAGALNAAALAEILQASPPGLDAKTKRGFKYKDRLPFQVDALRRFISHYLGMPRLVAEAFIPDSLEVTARDPLKPLELPIHFERERDAREVANEAKAGWVHLLNDFFGLRITIATATRIARKLLGIVESAERPNRFFRFGARLKSEAGLLWIAWKHFFELAPVAGTVLWALVIGPNRTALRGAQSATADKLMSARRIYDAVRMPFRSLLVLYLMAHVLLLASAGLIGSWILRAFPALFLRAAPAGPPGPPGKLSSTAMTRILEYYGLADGLANSDMIRQLLVKCFDPDYYGSQDISEVLERALARDSEPAAGTDAGRKRVGEYRTNEPPIAVAVVAARVSDGEMHVFSGDVPVVDALLAASAVIPLLPAVTIDETYEKERANGRQPAVRDRKTDGSTLFIDGANVSNEAIGPLLEHIRDELKATDDDAACLDVYPVSNLPVSRPKLPAEEGKKFAGILDVVPRALQLKRFRDATVEQRLTTLYSKVLPEGKSWYPLRLFGRDGKPLMDGNGQQKERVFVNANILPLELEKPVEINQRLLTGQDLTSYGDLIHETIADGCRASLEGMLPALIRKAAGTGDQILCTTVMNMRLAGETPLPGNDASAGPGLSEICARCALVRGNDETQWQGRATLRVVKERQAWPEWPKGDRETPIEFVESTTPDPPAALVCKGWPAEREGLKGSERPLVSLLFGGGVFRGVFHMGVMAALQEAGIRPDVVAGSSVGSIIAAMIAQVFSSNEDQKGKQIAHLAATFLCIDRLILTDRMADFVRRLTLRASETIFAPSDLDLLFRRYDAGSTDVFGRRMRAIAAGIERLTHISPFELGELTRDLRMQDLVHFTDALREDVQDFLDRGGVGEEILGTEPLSLLIDNHVLKLQRASNPAANDLFESFRDRAIYFLATATNLDQGELEIIGDVDAAGASQEASLLYGLLASSAFPAVFRPRRSWEIFRSSNHMHQYIDGGVIDNLPLDAVAQFLNRHSLGDKPPVMRRPPQPHLIFTASLETDPSRNGDFDADDCLAIRKRAKTFKYNLKVDGYAAAQRDLRAIYRQRVDEGETPKTPLLDLHVMAVKPKWLCSTFGFHPMLGFRRARQARSIAHGCASTLGALFQMENTAEGPAWLEAWGAKDLALDRAAFKPAAGQVAAGASGVCAKDVNSLVLKPQNRTNGQCWFRTGKTCPFSEKGLLQAGVDPKKIPEVSQIYALCGDPATHEATA